jgi:hypothetical protein
MSANEPGWIDGTPFLPADAIVEPTLGIRTDFSVEKAFLDDDTTYHVIVRAEDAHGVDYQVGEFHTGPPPPVNVLLTFEQINVQSDGDPHWGERDKGELSFEWGFLEGIDGADEVIGSRSQEKMHDGTVIALSSDNEAWLTLDGDEKFPAPGVHAREWDGVGAQFVDAFPKMSLTPENHHGGGRMNPAWGPELTLDEIKALPTCGGLGVAVALPDDYCFIFQSPKHIDKQYPNILVVVSYHLDT